MKFREVDAIGETQPAQSPPVGIFRTVGEKMSEIVLLTDRAGLSRDEPYGDCLTHPNGHYEVWEQLNELPLKAFRARSLPEQVRMREYEFYPRGRIVYEVPKQRNILYLDRKLATGGFVEIVTAGLV